MIKRLDKYQTLLEFLNIIAPKPYYMDLQMAECDWVVDNVKKAAAGHNILYNDISPEALNFVKTQSSEIFKNLAKFLEKIKGADFYNCEEDQNFTVVRAEIKGFLSLFDNSPDIDVVIYQTAVSVLYEKVFK